MARPRTPLISRENALETALRIIDADGVDALSIRRLAAELTVNGASLYHHFVNKEAILVGAAELALTRTPVKVRSDGNNWQHWMLDGARQLRDVLVAHPGLIPIIVQRRTLGVRAESLEVITRKLIAKGVPAEVILALYEALERFVIGTAVRQVRSETVVADSQRDGTTFPHLRLATVTRTSTDDELFDIVALGIMNAVRTSADPVADELEPRRDTSRAAPPLGDVGGDTAITG